LGRVDRKSHDDALQLAWAEGYQNTAPDLGQALEMTRDCIRERTAQVPGNDDLGKGRRRLIWRGGGGCRSGLRHGAFYQAGRGGDNRTVESGAARVHEWELTTNTERQL
jgi:hypothetical protein